MRLRRATQQSRKTNHEWRIADGRFPGITDRSLASSHESRGTATCIRPPQNEFLRPDHRVLKGADQSRNPAHRFRDPTQQSRHPTAEFLHSPGEFLNPPTQVRDPPRQSLDPPRQFLEAEMLIFNDLGQSRSRRRKESLTCWWSAILFNRRARRGRRAETDLTRISPITANRAGGFCLK
jgi:hypothetical protein